MNPDNARILRITAAAGTELADAYSQGTGNSAHVRKFLPLEKQFTTHSARLPARGMAGSGLRPLTNIPHCCLP